VVDGLSSFGSDLANERRKEKEAAVLSPAPSLKFREEVVRSTHLGERLTRCIQCGTCGGSCPNGSDMDSTPRQIINMINAGMADEVLHSNMMWKCVSCYLCTSRCPQEIPITEILYTLKRMAVREGHVPDEDAADLARTFADNVDRYGRSFELGLASRYYLTHKPISLARMGPLGLAMFMRGRLSLRPTRIRELKQLQAIIDKAKALGGVAA
jgi:heterodisulfide reductase subunit C